MDENATHLKLAKFSRYLGRISTATRVVGIIIVIAGILTMLFAFPQLFKGRREEDALALMLLALGIGGIGVLVWSTGVFHGAIAQGLVVFGWMDGKMWEMMKTLKQQGAAAATPVETVKKIAQPAGSPAQLAPATTAAIEAATAPNAGDTSSASPAPQEPSAGADGTVPAEALSAVPAATEASMAEVPAAETPVPPVPMKRCKHCGGEIPAHVLRCKHCLERV